MQSGLTKIHQFSPAHSFVFFSVEILHGFFTGNRRGLYSKQEQKEAGASAKQGSNENCEL